MIYQILGAFLFICSGIIIGYIIKTKQINKKEERFKELILEIKDKDIKFWMDSSQEFAKIARELGEELRVLKDNYFLYPKSLWYKTQKKEDLN
jgi:hypothetical protein